ncbi:MAG: c-type cytochrome [Methyloligellaceae bacterium]
MLVKYPMIRNAGSAMLAVTLLFIGFRADVGAHSGAKGIVKERMDVMKSIGAEMKKLGAVTKDPGLFNAAEIQAAAKALGAHAQRIPDLFPKGSTAHPSEARPEIWTDWEKFEALARDLANSAEELQTVSADQFKLVFLKAATTCKGCHQQFRIKK